MINYCELTPRTPKEKSSYLEGVENGRRYERRDFKHDIKKLLLFYLYLVIVSFVSSIIAQEIISSCIVKK